MIVHPALPRLLIIGGPTASGKSSLALEVAEQLNGIVINADSMQVYRELRILNARPDQQALTRAQHRLYGVLSATERCSAGRWREMAVREIEIAWNDGKLPVLVGGTGLYLKALIEGISKIPEVDPNLREEAIALHDRIGAKEFRMELAKVDLITAERLSEGDTQRLTRAYEVYLATGTPLSEWHRDAPLTPAINADIQTLLLLPPREELYAACNSRFDSMLKAGALGEVRSLMKLKLAPSLPAMKALGVPELVAHIRGKQSLRLAAEDAKRATRNYAKRQISWFSNHFGKSGHIIEQYSESLLEEIFSKIRFRC